MTYIIAHRGASKQSLENTLEAFLLARELGADWVEFDVRRSSDGVLIIHHDASLEDGRILAETSSTELPAHIPSLAEVLEALVDVGMNVEIKNDPAEPGFDPTHEIALSVIGAATAYVDYDRLLVSSFNPDTLAHVKSCDSKVQTGLLFFDPLTAFQNISRCIESGHSAIHPHFSSVDASFVKKAHAGGLKVNVWSVDKPEQIQLLAELGVDGIITNVPDVAKKVLDQIVL